MRVLWITNITFPEAQFLLDKKGTLKSSGGWLLGSANELVHQPDIKLFVASLSNYVNKLTRLEGERITYYLLPYGKGNIRVNHDYEDMWRTVQKEINPNVVHLHGTEFSHGLAYLEACGAEHFCVSIQGLVSVISNYYFQGLSPKELLRSYTLGTFLFGGIRKGYRNLITRGKCEIDILRRVHHIIGRTTWDRGRIWAINPNANYYHGGEILRAEFYDSVVWHYSKCTPHSIFLSQAKNPIKGLHMVLRALPLVRRHYPDVTLRIAGYNVGVCNTWKEKVRIDDYGNYIRKLIRDNNLIDCISFTGPLDGKSMRQEYLNCNVFICPSSIENSSNSLGEAQLLGVPVLASYVGGIPDMMKGCEQFLYRFEEVEMLAYKIVQLFEMKDKIDTVYMRKEAIIRHDPHRNIEELINIYNKVAQ